MNDRKPPPRGGHHPSSLHDDPTTGVNPDRMDATSALEYPVVRRELKLEPGMKFGPYEVIRFLGKGGFAHVWEAQDLDNGRRVALKILTALQVVSEESVDRFRREARLAASLSHPNCVYVFGADEIEGYPIITMELMSGGTLRDVLEDEGPLSVPRAVDFAIDLIDGLEAAEKRGIIHRDIKPSNCFLDRDGRAKIGDFGISKALELDAQLTMTGAFLGTPAYASPEQIRGRNVDLRSDLYSLGATLYALLTGRPAFDTDHPGDMVARILSESPTPFAEHQIEIPKGLRRVIFKLLAKEPDRRFSTYAEVRRALIPYSSRALAGARVTARFWASGLDYLVYALPVALPDRDSFSPLLYALVVTSIPFLYFFVQEALWGRTLGKLIVGVRIVSEGGGTARVRQVLVRNLIFWGWGSLLPTLVGGLVAANRGWDFNKFAAFISLILFGVLLVSMRRSNGFAAVYELLSGTRVVSRIIGESETATELGGFLDAAPAPTRVVDGAYGLYQAQGVLWEREGEALILGRDELLGRPVWIHTFSRRDQAPTVAALGRHTEGRLQWLQGSREEGTYWDAYEAPGGLSLREIVRQRGSLPWHDVRDILHRLAREMRLEGEGEEQRGYLDLDALWIDGNGHVRLLDFPVPASGPAEPAPTEMELPPESGEDGGRTKSFLREAALLCLEGERFRENDSRRALPRAPIPEHAHALMRMLLSRKSGAFELPEFIQRLDQVRLLPSQVTRFDRWRILTTEALGPLAAIILGLVLVVVSGFWGTPDMVQADEMMKVVEGTTSLDSFEPAEQAQVREAAGVMALHIADSMKESILKVDNDRLISKEGEPLVDSLRVVHGEVGDRELVAARLFLAQRDDRIDGLRLLPLPLMRTLIGLLIALVLALSVLILFLFPSLLFALVFRGSVLYSMYGVSVLTLKGTKAGRFRCWLRAMVSWAPIILFIPMTALLSNIEGDWVKVGWMVGLSLAVFALYVAMRTYALMHPARGIEDRIARTYLVPK